MKFFIKLILSLTIFFILGELLCYTYYFHKNSRAQLGWVKVVDKFNYLIKRENLKFQLPNNGISDEVIWEKFFTEGEEYMSFLKSEFDLKFQQFHNLSKSYNAKLVIIYIPQTIPGSFYNCSEKPSKRFFEELAQKYKLPYIDLSSSLSDQNHEHTTLYPGDNHLTRFGNYLVAQSLSSHLSKLSLNPKEHIDPKSGYSENIGNFGHFAGSYSTVHYGDASYEILINNIGIRGVEDLKIPKNSYRIACIGDSFTFGHGVLNEHTYPHILGTLVKNCEILNFGIPGTTITSHLDTLKNLSNLGIDLIFLEFGDTDLIDLMTHRQEIFSRVKPSSRPQQEYDFLKKIGRL